MNRDDAKGAKINDMDREPFQPDRIRFRRQEDQEFDPQTEQLAQRVIGAAIAVHKALGPGYLESVYEQALAIEFELLQIPFTRQRPFAIDYRQRTIGEGRLDFLVADCMVVELKAVERLAPIHQAQVISYLKATHLSLALLINFNVPRLKDGLKRIVLQH